MTPSWALLARVSLFGAAYLVFAEGGHLLSFRPSAFATFWPPSGLYLTALLLTERRAWPLLLLGGLAANLTSDVLLHGKTLPVSLAFAGGNALEALAGAWLLQRFAETPFTLNRVKNVLALATLPALLSTTLSATVGATTIWATQGEVSWVAVWFVWWSADALGILLVTPALLALAETWLVRRKLPSLWRIGEFVVLLLAVTGVAVFVFGQSASSLMARPVALLPLLLLAALRFGPQGSALAVLIPSLVIVWNTIHGVGVFAPPEAAVERQAVALQVALCLTSLSTLLLAALVSERREAEEALRAGEERYRTLVDGSIQGMYVHKDAIIQFANAALARVFGYESPADVIGQHYSVLVAPHERARLEATRTARLRGEPAPARFEFQGLRKDGTLLWIEVLPTLISWQGGPAVLVTFVDVTERKKAEEELRGALDQLRATQAQLVQAERLAATTELAGQFAHHLDNLLAVVLGRIELTLFKPEASEIRRSLEIAHRAGVAAAEVIQRIQRAGRMQPVLQSVPANVNELVQEALELVGGARSAGMPDGEIEVSFEPGELSEIRGDPIRLREALLNVLLNALEALPGRGRVVVKTWASGPWVYCSVADTGVGMSEELRARALEPLFTTKGLQRLGLGLSVAHGIIQQHRGGVHIESAEGQGTTVTLSLPVAQGQTESA